VSFVTAPDVFRDQPVLTGQLVRLEPWPWPFSGTISPRPAGT